MSEDQPKPVPVQREITRTARAACLLVSLAGLTAGGVATFKTENEVGTGGLLLVGVFAGVVAILQRIPRLKWGDNEIDPGFFAQQASDLAETAGDAAKELAEGDKTPDEIAEGTKAAVQSEALRDLATWLASRSMNDSSRRAMSEIATLHMSRDQLRSDVMERIERMRDEMAQAQRPTDDSE